MTKPQTPSEHAKEIVEAIERAILVHTAPLSTANDIPGYCARVRTEAHAALTEAIRAALESVRAPAWVPATNMMHQAEAAEVERKAIDNTIREHREQAIALGRQSERAAIVKWLHSCRPGAIGENFRTIANAIEKGEHLAIRGCKCMYTKERHARGFSTPGPHHEPSCPLYGPP